MNDYKKQRNIKENGNYSCRIQFRAGNPKIMIFKASDKSYSLLAG
jgi:hypothetical protein